MQRATTAPARLSQVRTITNTVTGETLEFIKTAAETGGAYLEFHVTALPGFGGPPRHIHTRQEEAFRVISGRLGIEINGETQVLNPGEECVVPAGTAHRWWVEGDEPLKGWTRVTPALHFTEILDAVNKSANARGSATPGLVDSGVILTRYRDEYIPVFLPLPARLIVMPVLGLIGRLTGRAGVVDEWIGAHYAPGLASAEPGR